MPKDHPMPLSGGDRKALKKELTKSRAMTTILARQSDELRAEGEALIQKADRLACESWNERMWADGGPAQPSPTIAQAINAGFPWLEVTCSRCKKPSSIDLAAMVQPADFPIWRIEGARGCQRCAKARATGRAVLQQLAPRARHDLTEM